MSLLSYLASCWRTLTHKARLEHDLDAEVRSYLDMLAEEKAAQGLTGQEARRAARLDAGGVEQIKEAVRDVRAGVLPDILWQDVRHSMRQLRQSPAFTWTAVLSLALGIGANTAVFTVVRAVLIAPLPYRDAGRLAVVWEHAPRMGFPKSTVAFANYVDWKTQNRVFTDMAAVVERSAVLLGGEEPEPVVGQAVTGNAFDVLGTPAWLGRTLTPADDLPGDRVVVISYDLWQRRFGGAGDIVGRRVPMNIGLLVQDQPDPQWTIMGVMPRGFHFFSAASDFWIPARFRPEILARRGMRNLTVFGRLRPGVTWNQAQTEMTGIAARLERQYPDTNQQRGARVVPLREEFAGESREVLLLLQGATFSILLIACANLANLLVARGNRRTREIAMRMALGAGRTRLLRQFLTESLLLAAVGAAFGLILAASITSLLVHLIPTALSRTAQLRLDLPVLGFTAAVSVVTALVFGFGPAWRLSKAQIGEALKQGGAAGAGRSLGRLRDALVVAEVSIALVLLIGAGLLIESMARMKGADPGFRAAYLLTMRVSPRYADAARREQLYNAVLDRIRALPGVVSAGFVNRLPYTSQSETGGLLIEGRQIASEQADALYRATAGDYLQTIGVRLREGRLLAPSDRAETEPVVVINETFARLYWPNESPLGRRIIVDSRPLRTIVGVVTDIRERGLDSFPKPVAYIPAVQRTGRIPADLAVRTVVPPLSLANAVRRSISEVEPNQAVSAIRTMEDILDADTAARHDQMFVLNTLALLALLLAVGGVYGVLRYAVTQRAREIAVRMAVGAAPNDVVRLVIGLGLRLIAAGILLGTWAALGLTRLMKTMLFGVTATDLRTFALAGAVIIVSGFVASLLPARRASRLDPVIPLRNE